MNKSIRRGTTVFLTAIFAISSVGVLPAAGNDVGDREKPQGRILAKFDPANPTKKFEKSYRKFESGTNNNGTIVNTPPNCRKIETCDIIRIEVDSTGTNGEPFYMVATLTWPNHCEQPKNPGDSAKCPTDQINLNLHMWEPNDHHDDPDTPGVDESKDVDGTETTDWLGRNTSASKHPETFSFGADVPEGKLSHFYLLVVNTTAGKNPTLNPEPYKVSVEFKLASFENFEPPPKTPPPRPESKAAIAKALLGGTGGGAPKPTLSPVKVPGADGPLTEQTLIAFAGQRRGPEKQPSSPLVPGIIGLAVLGAVTFGFFFIRGRRTPV